jgi:ankyrin repeat protein
MQDHLGFTALVIACEKGHVYVARLLIERGAAIDYQNKVRAVVR